MKSRIDFVLVLLITLIGKLDCYNPQAFGGWAISEELFLYIHDHVEHGKNILELGSGLGSKELAKYFNLFSVEHDKKWLHKYEITYIYAPIKKYRSYEWFDIDFLKNLPKEYDLLLVDGPSGHIGRYGFYNHINLFNTSVTIIFDDVQREDELRLLKAVASKLKRPYEIYVCKDGNEFGVVQSCQ